MQRTTTIGILVRVRVLLPGRGKDSEVLGRSGARASQELR